jgi:hypothetical protein
MTWIFHPAYAVASDHRNQLLATATEMIIITDSYRRMTSPARRRWL